MITLDRSIKKLITEADDSMFPVEVASLSRSVVFEAEGQGIGGHLIVHHTHAKQHMAIQASFGSRTLGTTFTTLSLLLHDVTDIGSKYEGVRGNERT